MTMMRRAPTGPIQLHPLEPWTSAEKFRATLSDNLKSVVKGSVGTLHTKQGTFRLLTDEDFQELFALAEEVYRLRDGLEVVIAAAITVDKHKDNESIQTLTRAAAMVARSPVLPTREGHQPFNISNIKPDDSETVEDEEIDFSSFKRPV